MKIEKLSILGVGLIGGSLARALKRADVCKTIVGYGRNEDNLKKAVDLGVIDEFSLSAKGAVRNADVVVVATPLSTNAALFDHIREALSDDTVITDVGSAKRIVVQAARERLGQHFRNFVPGHPIAGKEKSGVEASTADLYENHIVILTPGEETSVHALSTVTSMWEATLADVIHLKVEHHDDVLAATSHLPHLLAYALVDCLARKQQSEEVFAYAAGGFLDFTRIASSDPRMWHDICLANKDSLLNVLDLFGEHLKKVRIAIEEDDSEKIFEVFSRAKETRDSVLNKRDPSS